MLPRPRQGAHDGIVSTLVWFYARGPLHLAQQLESLLPAASLPAQGKHIIERGGIEGHARAFRPLELSDCPLELLSIILCRFALFPSLSIPIPPPQRQLDGTLSMQGGARRWPSVMPRISQKETCLSSTDWLRAVLRDRNSVFQQGRKREPGEDLELQSTILFHTIPSKTG